MTYGLHKTHQLLALRQNKEVPVRREVQQSDVDRCELSHKKEVLVPSSGRPSTSRRSSRRHANEEQAPMPSSSGGRPLRRRNESDEPVPSGGRPIRRRNESDEEIYERKPVRTSRRSSSIRSRKETVSSKQDYEEEERRARRRASSRSMKMREEPRVEDNERRYRRHSRDSRHHERMSSRSGPFLKSDSSDTETEMLRYRRKYTHKPDSDIDSGSDRRKGKTGPSKGEIFLKSLKEAKNICFFKNPFFEENAQYTGDFLMNNIQQSQVQKMQQMGPSKDTWLYNYGDGESKNAKPQMRSPDKQTRSPDKQTRSPDKQTRSPDKQTRTPILPLRDSGSTEKKAASSPNFPAQKKNIKSANYRSIQPNFAQAMRNQVNNPYVPSYAYPSFAQPTCLGYKQKYVSSMYSPRTPKNEVDT